jgi:glycosyltransferase involved in cell wall biosynthesis
MRVVQDSSAVAPRQLLIDISVIRRHDAHTGIQRVVRALLDQLLSNAPVGYVVRPVAATRKQPYRYVHWSGEDATDQPIAISIQKGDIFLGLDLAAHIVPVHRRQLSTWKANGASLHFMVYDILPLQHPEWFSLKLVAAFRRWIKAVAILADQAICISRTVESDLLGYFERRYGLDPRELNSTVIPLGCDIGATRPTSGLPFNFSADSLQIRRHATALMVGTLEPRKGHAQIVSAFEELWARGKQYNLVLVGRPGWKTEVLQAKLNNHPLLGQHLFWFADASDEALLALYEMSDGLVIASYAEGFGLPLLEALRRGKPVLARDLPVFRQHAFGGVEFFSTDDAQVVSQVIEAWLDRTSVSPVSRVQHGELPAWRDAATALVASFGRAPLDPGQHTCSIEAHASRGIS